VRNRTAPKKVPVQAHFDGGPAQSKNLEGRKSAGLPVSIQFTLGKATAKSFEHTEDGTEVCHGIAKVLMKFVHQGDQTDSFVLREARQSRPLGKVRDYYSQLL
jgi:hypothetical protein